MSVNDPRLYTMNTSNTSNITFTSNNTGSLIGLNLPGDKNYQALLKQVEELEKRMLIINPNNDLHEKYPALKEAYDEYQLISAIVDNKGK